MTLKRKPTTAKPSKKSKMMLEATLNLEGMLKAMAPNLWSTWNHGAVELWRRTACAIGTRSNVSPRNPWTLVAALDGKVLSALEADAEYRKLLKSVFLEWIGLAEPHRPPAGLSADRPVAYFSMEFGVHESLAVYAGGLGILAGDHAKSASDEAVPLVGVGLFYHNGYFRQELDGKDHQRVVYPRADLSRLPIEALCDRPGKEIRIPVEFPDRVVSLKLWKLQVGRARILMLDSDIRENRPEDRKITYRLYGGSREDRMRQEIVAGIGGVRALRAAGRSPGVWHLNEGHVAFLTLERLREVRKEHKLSVAEGLELIAADTVFTTHTPVPEGNEVFDLPLARRYLARHAEAAGIPVDEYLALGLDHGKDGRPFLSMTVLALRLSRFRNGVSALHGQVSRRMWSKLWPGFSAEETPITSVTNGIHTSTWVAPEMHELLAKHVGSDWERRLDDAKFWKGASRLPEKDLWSVKQGLKRRMVEFVRERERVRLERTGLSPGKAASVVKDLLDPEIFTIGFARRFALYKRANLLFRDLQRARKLFESSSRPLQIIFSGKPHPEDAQGKKLFEEVAAISRQKAFRGRIALVENYDIHVAQHLVQGVDLWLNNPRRPLEASGTSGQKVPVNCGLNCSILDGWWCEGYAPATGWAFGKPIDYPDESLQDREDSEALYRVLEKEILPLYYRRDQRGMPLEWIRKVKTSMADLVPRFSTSHMVLEYARQLYRPAFENGNRVGASQARQARELAAWKDNVRSSWPLVHVRRAARTGQRGVEIEVFLGGIAPRDLLCRESSGADHPASHIKDLGAGLYRLRFQLQGGPAKGVAGSDVTILRLYPTHSKLVHPHELALVTEVAL